jgi:type I restriction enzyme M protein
MTPDIRQKLDKITDTMWSGGLANPITYVEQLSYLLYLKLLDEAENQHSQAELLGITLDRPTLFPAQAKRYRWSEWRFKSGRDLLDFVGDEVFPYMSSLVREAPAVATFFADARFQFEDPHVLKEVVDILDTFQFAKLGPDVKGDIFEYQLLKLQNQAKSDLGQFRTPRQLRQFMVQLVDPDIGDSIYDPACGTAGFLVEALDHILAKYSSETRLVPIYGEGWEETKGFKSVEAAKKAIPNLQIYPRGIGDRLAKDDWKKLEAAIYGHDVSGQMVRVAQMNLVLHGVPRARIRRANALSETGGLTEDDKNRRYKVIIANPPFAGLLPKDSIRSDLPTNSKKSELLFLAIMMDALAPGGRCAVVVPEGLLFGSTEAHVDLRKKLVNEFHLQAVISLPAGVFKPYAGVKTSVLVFSRPAAGADRPENLKLKTENSRRVWFYEIKNDGYDPDKVSGGGRVVTENENGIPGLLAAWAIYKASNFQNPPGPEANTLLESDAEEPACWWASIERIAESAFSLSAANYKPSLPTRTNAEDPLALVDELLILETNITNGLKNLRKQLNA